MLTWKQQQRLLRFIAALSIFCIAHLMIVNQNNPSAVISTPAQHQQGIMNKKRKDVTEDYLSACLFLDDASSSSSSDLSEWLAYHYHVLPLRVLIVAVHTNDPTTTTTTTTDNNSSNSQQQPPSIRQVFDKYRRNSHSSSLTILEWIDVDFMTRPIVHHHVTPILVTVEERRRIFFYRCVQALQQQHHRHHHQQQHYADVTGATPKPAWSWLVHSVDEYLVVHPQGLKMMRQHKRRTKNKRTTSIPNAIQDPGLVLRWLQWWNDKQQQDQEMKEPTKRNPSTTDMAAAAAPCFEMETWNAVNDERHHRHHAYNKQHSSMRALNTTSLRTWKLRQGHRWNGRAWTNSRLLLDLTRIPLGDIVPHNRHSHPIPPNSNINSSISTKCQHVSFVAVMQVPAAAAPQLSTSMQETKPLLDPEQGVVHIDVRPWTVGFIQSVGETAAMELLGNAVHKYDTQNSQAVETPTAKEERCAMLFFGLPRAYDTMVLPSIARNVLVPNARHNCDVFVHYYYMASEPAGRLNNGGAIDPTSILRLADQVRLVASSYSSIATSGNNWESRQRRRRAPHVEFTHDTDEAFWYLRNHTVQKYLNTTNEDGQYLYFPYKAFSYVYPSSLNNIVKQWHSIESVWNLMERAMRQGIANYTRVALLRNDVMFITPIDIYRTSMDDKKDDGEGRFAIVPPFGLYPVNDRLVYGSYRAVRIWATKRFEYIEDHVRAIMKEMPGHGMHSEIFLKTSIFAAMEREAGVKIIVNPDICFFRTRADNTAMISDCDAQGTTRGMPDIDKEAVVKEISGFTNCTRYKPKGSTFEAMTCTS